MPEGGTVSRFAYAAVLKSSETEHEEFFASFPNRRDLTGICLVQDNTLFNILECHVEDMFPILRAVNKMKCIKVCRCIYFWYHSERRAVVVSVDTPLPYL